MRLGIHTQYTLPQTNQIQSSLSLLINLLVCYCASVKYNRMENGEFPVNQGPF